MYITAQGPRLRNDLYCVEWDVKLYYTIPLLSIVLFGFRGNRVSKKYVVSTILSSMEVGLYI